ncbi:PAS domain S-box protein [Rhodococcus tibetensis]|uniref:PAS domain S-box protein n=1 Tax=Rhodococcus tibetensis TaxID=2965064 RepID=A0ABT1QA92_9NOCA|nr:PAS domain S-box protein [Rhodococcus sp. FXJ9.536]MCQ4119199.1 PAS domain S-box protein [Rhodococcus sp. FXJ9.536]
MKQLDSEGFAAMLESVPHAISVHDKNRQVIFSNSACAALIGAGIDEFATLEHEQLFHPDDTELWKAMLARALGDEKASATAHLRIHHCSGHWIWAHVAASAFEAGTETLIVLVLQDQSDTIWGNPKSVKQTI